MNPHPLVSHFLLQNQSNLFSHIFRISSICTTVEGGNNAKMMPIVAYQVSYEYYQEQGKVIIVSTTCDHYIVNELW